MATLKNFVVAGVMLLGATGSAIAQVSRAEAEQIHQRQQIAQMEGALQLAVVHGADLMYAQFRSVFQDRPRLGSQPRVSGFTLPGYGTVFTVDVPMIQLPILYEVLIREQEYRNASTQLQRMQAQLNGLPPGRERDQLQDAISRYEQRQRLGIGALPDGARPTPNGAPAVSAGITGGAAVIEQKDADDPQTVYSREVKAALIEAMLTNSQGLSIKPDEWLTVRAMARETDNAAPGASVDTNSGIIRVKGSVLAAFRAGTISKEEALKQVEVLEQ